MNYSRPLPRPFQDLSNLLTLDIDQALLHHSTSYVNTLFSHFYTKKKKITTYYFLGSIFKVHGDE